jgi:DNA segregation ATPase FtsK/SpoIIIE, S-DNA-T family
VRKATSIARDEGLQRELWGLALLALALLLTLSFIPPWLLGEAGARLFPTGNIVGRAGFLVSQAARDLFGLTAFLLPLFPALGAAHALGRLDAPRAARWATLLIGVLLLVPLALYCFARPLGSVPVGAGWLGAALGTPLSAGFGWLGAGLLVVFTFAALCVATFRWNPLRSLASGGSRAVARAWGVASRSRVRLPRLRLPLPRRGAPAAGRHPEAAPGDWLPDETLLVAPPAAEPEPPAPWEVDEPEAVPALAGPAPSRAAARAKPDRAAAREPRELALPDPGDPASPDLPPAVLLADAPRRDEVRSRREMEELGRVLIDKLATFKIAGEIVGTTTGPVVTQFEVSPAPGIKVARIANLDADLALALRAASVRIVAPIPGKAAVGVEVPNPEPEMVFFREVLESAAFRGSRAQLPLALGKDLAGRPYVADLAKMPHLLIAGATGSGKSVCINTIVTSLIYRHSPRTLRLLMVDPKMVELSMYNDLPHLRHPVVTDNQEAASVLKWAVLEMERRYALLSANAVRNLQDFNQRAESGQLMRAVDPSGEEGDPDRWTYRDGPLPYIVLIIDELADLMMTVQGEVEKPLALLAQKARAIGIHLILATQRPSVNVITGLIKANFPSRIAFRVASKVDSRTILDQNGADSLLGNGDMLFLPPGQSDPLRIQGAFLSTGETESLMDWYREQARLRREEAIREGRDPESAGAAELDILELVRAAEGESDEYASDEEAIADRDKLFREAAELCVQHQGGSTSLLQRRLRIGYGRAARVIDQLHHAGILGPPDGSKPREVLVDLLQLDQIAPDD